MLNPHMIADLRRAERIFRKGGHHNLADACHRDRGALADSMHPNPALEASARHLVMMANEPDHAPN